MYFAQRGRIARQTNLRRIPNPFQWMISFQSTRNFCGFATQTRLYPDSLWKIKLSKKTFLSASFSHGRPSFWFLPSCILPLSVQKHRFHPQQTKQKLVSSVTAKCFSCQLQSPLKSNLSVQKAAGYLAFLGGGTRGHLLAAPEVQQELLHGVLHADPLERSSVLLSAPHVWLNCGDTKTKNPGLKPPIPCTFKK